MWFLLSRPAPRLEIGLPPSYFFPWFWGSMAYRRPEDQDQKKSLSVSSGALGDCLPKVPGPSFKEGKVKIRKGEDGTSWFFDEHMGGWIRVGDTEFNLEGEMVKEHVEYDPGDFLNKATRWEMDKHKDLSFAVAFARVQQKYPGMAQRLQDQMWGNWPPKNWIPVK